MKAGLPYVLRFKARAQEPLFYSTTALPLHDRGLQGFSAPL